MKILVYNDYGVVTDNVLVLRDWLTSNLPHSDVQFTTADEIINKDALAQKNVKALFMPGGQSRHFKKMLGAIGDAKIRKFVEAGGAYYGICAGGYYPSRVISFKGKDFSILKENNKADDLVFYNGVAKGSIPEFSEGNYYDDSVMSAAVVDLEYGDGFKARSYYHGGGAFMGAFNTASCTILATYKDRPEGANAAIIQKNVGKGYAVLSGVHPEVSSEYFDDWTVSNKFNKAVKEKIFQLQSKLDETKELNSSFHQVFLANLM